MTLRAKVRGAFERRFDELPAVIVRAPGRVNLIGEHTDYNDGFVLPMAIDRAVWLALRPRRDRQISVFSLDFDEQVDIALDELEHSRESSWAEYIKGVAWALQEVGHALAGWEGVTASDVPIGAGLSSSAALELAIARAFAFVSGFEWHPVVMARLCQRAENEWVGMPCGIMDQMISAGGQAGHALLIDCRSLETELAPLPNEFVIVVMDTGTRRGLVNSAYNERRAQCEDAAQFFKVQALRDVTLEQFHGRADELDSLTRRRAHHVITENARTLDAVAAMREGDVVRLGTLMDASHASLRDDYEVSSDALNTMVEIARGEPGCLGARMTGAGFGGCAVALVERNHANTFSYQVAKRYQAVFDTQPDVFVCYPTNGADTASSWNGPK